MSGGQWRKPELTLDQVVKNMQAAWTSFRNAQLFAFHSAVSALKFARANEDDFRVYCKGRSIRGDLLETQVAELMVQNDPDADAISRERRAEYGACIGWFADPELCPHTEPSAAIAFAQNRGRMKGIAKEYRDKNDAGNPTAKAAKLNGQVKEKARRQGSQNNVSRAASAAAAQVLAEQMDSEPTTMSPSLEPGHDFCAADGDSDAMVAFMSHHGISAGVKHELDGDNHVQIYLRVWNSADKQFHLFGPALDPELAGNLANIIVREHLETAPKVAEPAQ